MKRCQWCENSFPEYVRYHDEEWGVPIHDDQKQFEFLILEGAQAGLSWSTILKRRNGYRSAFAKFDFEAVAKFDQKKIDQLLLDTRIIRNKLKVNSAVTNAKAFVQVREEFGTFDKYLWSFVGGKPIINQWKTDQEIPATSKESDVISKDLKKRGFKFVGTTIIYAHMQAVGMVNNHVTDCFRYKDLT